jgi:hypothetical protein
MKFVDIALMKSSYILNRNSSKPLMLAYYNMKILIVRQYGQTIFEGVLSTSDLKYFIKRKIGGGETFIFCTKYTYRLN